MLESQTIIQSPKIKVVVKRLELKTEVKKTSGMEYDEITKVAIALLKAKINGHDNRAAWVAKTYPNVKYQDVREKINEAGGNPDNFQKTEVPKEVPIYKSTAKEVCVFSPVGDNFKSLQSFTFSLSKNDVNGSFSLAFFPEKVGKQTLWDKICILDIVEIYESKFENNSIAGSSSYSFRENCPVFIGVIKNKKYTAQATESGVVRRLQVSGISAAGLISQFFLNLDTTAMAITDQLAETESLRKELTLNIAGKDKPIKDVIKAAWEFFCNLAKTKGTVAIKSLLDLCATSNVFDCDDSKIYYPFSNLVLGQQTQDFYSLIDGLTPSPVYERFATMDFKEKKMKIVIRQVPFREDGAAECYKDSNGNRLCWSNIYNRDIQTKEIKSVELNQSDNEVYTVFFSYLNGYPIQTDKLMKIIAMEKNAKSAMLSVDDKKYQTYGYRPLIATFNGYDTTDKKNDDKTESNLQKINDNLKKWFGDLDRMLTGYITVAMTAGIEKNKYPIMPGEVIGFMGGQFYVEGITHNWTYGQGGDVNISVSRGGIYKNGSFSPFNSIGDRTDIIEHKKELEGSRGYPHSF